MARIPQVTRTIITTEATVLGVDIITGEACNKTAVLPRTYKDADKLLKAAKKALEDDTFKVATVVEYSVVENLYGMTEEEFVQHAQLLPPRTAVKAE